MSAGSWGEAPTPRGPRLVGVNTAHGTRAATAHFPLRTLAFHGLLHPEPALCSTTWGWGRSPSLVRQKSLLRKAPCCPSCLLRKCHAFDATG